MLSIVKSMALSGLDGYLVEVQTDITGGLPGFEIVGLPDTSVKEAKERIRAAIKNSGIDFLSRRILINLAPAHTKKEGTSFDLPMAIGILLATKSLIPKIDLKETVFVGELSLDGKIDRVDGILPICIDMKKVGIKKIVLPKENAKEALVVQGIEIIPVKDLRELIEILRGNKKIKQVTINAEELLKSSNKYDVDFSEVKGQENIKRALEVVAAGGHNCILIGSPGARKDNDGKEIAVNITRFNI